MIYTKTNTTSCAQAIDRFIGLKVKSLRFKRGWSPQKFASILNITYSELKEYEAGTKKINPSILNNMAKICGTQIDYFYHGLDAIITMPLLNTKTIEKQ